MNTRTQALYYDMVISGMSLAGMATAIEALQAGMSVLIINIRNDEFTLSQRIVLSTSSREYLVRMRNPHLALQSNDQRFLKKLRRDVTLSLKSIQSYLYRRMLDYERHPQQLTVMLNSQLTSVQLTHGLATVQVNNQRDQTKIFFTYIIGADGAGRHCLNLMNDALNPTQQMQLVTLNQTSYHIFAEVLLEHLPADALKDKYIYIANTNTGPIALLTKHTHPINHHQLYVVKLLGSFPAQILSTSDYVQRMFAVQQFIIKQTHATLSTYNIDSSNCIIHISHQKIKHGKIENHSPRFFKQDVKQCTQASLSINQHNFIATGDCYRTAQYQQGHGGNHALAHARFLGQVFKGKETLTSYQQFAARLADKVQQSHAFYAHSATLAKAFADTKLRELSEHLAKSGNPAHTMQ